MDKKAVINAIDVTDLNVSYNKHLVIDNLSMSVAEGEVVAIIGRSGCGKSTLLRSICALQKADKGDVFLKDQKIIENGIPLYEESEIRSNIMMVPQHPALLPYMTVSNNISIGLKIVLKLSNKEVTERTKEIAHYLGIFNILDNYPEEISGGQAQRVQLARVLVLHPSVLLLDEVTSSIDPQTTAEVVNALWKIKNIEQNINQTIVIVTHLFDFVAEFANNVMFLNKGNIYEEGLAQSFFINAKKSETKDFLSKRSFSNPYLNNK